MGVVWRAHDQLLDREVAVKEVQIAETLTAQERANAYQRTLREAKTAARLSHPGVVSVYDVADDGGRPWIVMELVNSRSLDQVPASNGPLSPRQTAEMGRQLLSALSVAHRAGVLHRDVKPSNVLLGVDGRAVLTDFGIATFQGDPKLTQTGMVMGSPGFTAPERIRGGDATPSSDLWSLGATLYAAVEGCGPYESRGGAITTMSAIINEDAPQARTAGALGPVIDALLRREPEDRPDATTATRMISDILHLLPERSQRAGGYEATALSASPSAAPAQSWVPAEPRIPQTRVPDAGANAGAGLGASAVAGAVAADAAGAAAADVGSLAASGTPMAETSMDSPAIEPPVAAGLASPPTLPQPGLGDPGTAGQADEFGSASRFPAQPAPDFSSWYDPSPRSGARSAAGYGSQAQAGGQSGYGGPGGYGGQSGFENRAWQEAQQPAGQAAWDSPAKGGRRSSGLRWKLALAALALIGAGAGAATIMALRHHSDTTSTSGESVGQSTRTGNGNATGTGTGSSPTGAPLSVNYWIDKPEPASSSLPGFRPYSRSAADGGTTSGFQIAYPDNWSISQTSPVRIKFQDSAASNVYLLADLTPHTYQNMVREATYIRNQSLAKGAFPGYKQLGLAALTIRGRPGAYWKFIWDDNGVQQEVLDVMYIANTSAGPQSYALFFTAPVSQWDAMHQYFDVEARTFAPLPS